MMRRKTLWLAAAIVLGIGTSAVLGVGWYASGVVIHPPQDPCAYRVEDYPDLPLENVEFASRDGLRLVGWFVAGDSPATIVLAHGRGGDKCSMLPHADYLHRAGFSVLLFDFRFRGASEGDAQTLGVKESWDLQSAVDYLRCRPDVDPERIGVLGNSMGAATALLAAAEKPEIKGVVAEIPYTSGPQVLCHFFDYQFGLPCLPFAYVTKWFSELRTGVDFDQLSPIAEIGKISPRPVLLIDDGLDDFFPCKSVELLYAAASAPREFWSVPDAPHGKGFDKAPQEFERRVVAFWRQTFGRGDQTVTTTGAGPSGVAGASPVTTGMTAP